MKIAGKTRQRLFKDLHSSPYLKQFTYAFVDLLMHEGIADTNDLPYWRWKELIQQAHKLEPSSPKSSNTAEPVKSKNT